MLSMKCVLLFSISHFGYSYYYQPTVCSSCIKLTSSVFTKCDPCMIWEMSHSNPKVLFTFQFGSRIVPVLREQDIRKSPASIAFQPTNYFSLPFPYYCVVFSAVIGCLAAVGCWEPLVFSVLWPPWMQHHMVLPVQPAFGCKRVTDDMFLCLTQYHTEKTLTLHACLLQSCFPLFDFIISLAFSHYMLAKTHNRYHKLL